MFDLGDEIFAALVGIGEAVAQVVPIEVLIGLLALVVVAMVVVAALLAGAPA